jgi:hypothetical protein
MSLGTVPFIARIYRAQHQTKSRKEGLEMKTTAPLKASLGRKSGGTQLLRFTTTNPWGDRRIQTRPMDMERWHRAWSEAYHLKQIIGLLHCGLDMATPEECSAMLCFYLRLADGHCRGAVGSSAATPDQQISATAFKMLCNQVFGKGNVYLLASNCFAWHFSHPVAVRTTHWFLRDRSLKHGRSTKDNFASLTDLQSTQIKAFMAWFAPMHWKNLQHLQYEGVAQTYAEHRADMLKLLYRMDLLGNRDIMRDVDCRLEKVDGERLCRFLRDPNLNGYAPADEIDSLEKAGTFHLSGFTSNKEAWRLILWMQAKKLL